MSPHVRNTLLLLLFATGAAAEDAAQTYTSCTTACAMAAVQSTACYTACQNDFFGNAIGGASSNTNVDLGDFGDLSNLMNDAGFGSNGASTCIANCAVGLLNSQWLSAYIAACVSPAFSFESFGTAGVTLNWCSPACSRSLFEYINEYVTCVESCDLSSFGGLFDIDTMMDGFQSQMDVFMGCGGASETGGSGFSLAESWVWSITSGDPHFKTLDGAEYAFNGKGDFWLVFDEQDEQGVQVRLDQCDEETMATCLTAVMIETGIAGVNKKMVQVMVDENSELVTKVDGTELTVSSGGKTEELGSAADKVVLNSANRVSVQSINGYKIDVFVEAGIMNVAVGLVEELKGRVAGLYGNFDGTASNDFVARDGTAYGESATDAELFPFGESWRVGTDESYADTAAPDHLGWTPQFVADVTVTPEAKAACDGLDGTALASCHYDVSVSGNVAFADVTRRSAEILQNKVEKESVTTMGTSSSSNTGRKNDDDDDDDAASTTTLSFATAIAAAVASMAAV